MKRCYIISGPNGAGKTTFAKAYLPREGECLNFINADLIAEGLSPFSPESVALEAGKLVLGRIEELVLRGEPFAFESTLSGSSYIHRIREWKGKGYEIVIYFLKLPSDEMAIERVRLRVAEGGHNVPEETIKRRFHRGWKKFQENYKHLADAWVVFDNSGETPVIVEESS